MSYFKTYRCLECEHLYDEAKGDKESGLHQEHYIDVALGAWGE